MLDENAFQAMTEKMGLSGDSYLAVFNMVALYESARHQPAPKQEQPMPRDTRIDCLLEAFESLTVAREAGDDAGLEKAAGEFMKWLGALDGWEPIETAPKTALKRIDILDEGERRVPDCYWSRHHKKWRSVHFDEHGQRLEVRNATHWMYPPRKEQK